MHYKLAAILNQEHVACSHAPGFLKLLLFAHQYVCVCVLAPEGINNQWCDTYGVI